jgi:hypothetical protein
MYRVYPEPGDESGGRFPDGLANPACPDDLAHFAQWWEGQENGRVRFAWALRDSLDGLLDGQRTGRWAYEHLGKTEKTHLGTMVEITLTKEFQIEESGSEERIDWRVADDLIDCKYSKAYGGWEIPLEMYSHPDRPGTGSDRAALLVWMNDHAGQWAAGLFRATDERLMWKRHRTTRALELDESGARQRGGNRDGKRRIDDDAVSSIHWLWGGRQSDLPRNVILHMDPEVRQWMFAGRSGQERVNRLLAKNERMILTRNTVLTVANQDDGMKRARDARLARHLGQRGFVVLGHQDASPLIAEMLGLDPCEKGELMSCRVVPVDADSPRPRFHADGGWWAAANDDEPESPAPQIPQRAPSGGWSSYLAPSPEA